MSKDEVARQVTGLLRKALMNGWNILEVTPYDPQERDHIQLMGNAEADLKRLFEDAYKADPEFLDFGRIVKQSAHEHGLLCEGVQGDWYLLSGEKTALEATYDALSPRHTSNIFAVKDFIDDFADRLESFVDQGIGWTPPTSAKN